MPIGTRLTEQKHRERPIHDRPINVDRRAQDHQLVDPHIVEHSLLTDRVQGLPLEAALDPGRRTIASTTDIPVPNRARNTYGHSTANLELLAKRDVIHVTTSERTRSKLLAMTRDTNAWRSSEGRLKPIY